MRTEKVAEPIQMLTNRSGSLCGTPGSPRYAFPKYFSISRELSVSQLFPNVCVIHSIASCLCYPPYKKGCK